MSIADYLVDKMLQKNIVVDDKEIYIYGLNNGIMILINFMTTFFLSFMMQKTFILLFFLVSFIPLRSYCGGIHCKSRILCYFTLIEHSKFILQQYYHFSLNFFCEFCLFILY